MGIEVVKWRSEFIARNAVLTKSKYPIKSSKYWHCIREELVFFDELIRETIEYERLSLKKQKIQLQIDYMGNSKMELIDKKLLHIDIVECDVKMLHLKRDSKERVREVRMWEKIKNELNDGSFDINNPEVTQEEHWINRWNNDINNG